MGGVNLVCRVSIGGPLWLNSLIETKSLLRPGRFEFSSTWSGIFSRDFTNCCLGILRWAHMFQTLRAPWQHLQEHLDTAAWALLILCIGETRFRVSGARILSGRTVGLLTGV